MTNDDRSIRTIANSAFAGLGIRSDLRGEPYISWLRCSGISQADTSPDGQKEVNDAFCAIQQMPWAGYDVYAEAVSGSQSFNREDLEEILHLKRTRNDFTKVIVFEYSRATRAGIRHGNVVEDELRKAGIELISSTELIPEGPIGDLLKSIKHFSNQQQAHNISKSVARGLAQSLAKASRPASGRTPFGLDRLYLGPNGTPRTLIRWDGLTQLRLDPITYEEVGRAVRQPARRPMKPGQRRPPGRRAKRFVGYKKQDDETSVLIPGTGTAAEAIRTLLRMLHIEGLGAHRCIQRLNAKGILAPEGDIWSMTTVRNLLRNPIYIGKEVRHRWTKALYHKLGPDGPIPVKVDQDALRAQGRKSVPMSERPRDEWILVDKPMLKDFLPPDVREAATTYLTRLYDADVVTAKQARGANRKNKADDNPYVLSQVLRSRQTDHAMRGETNTKRGPNGERHIRRYYFDYYTASKAISGLPARRIPAVPLEEAVVPAVFEALFDKATIDSCVRRYIANSGNGPRDIEHERRNLNQERDEIGRRLKRVHKTSGHLTDEELEAVVADDNARIIAIRHALATLDRDEAYRPPTSDEAIAALSARLAALPTDWRTVPNNEMKHLLATVIESCVIDLATREVTLSIRVPANLLDQPLPIKHDDEVRVNFRSLWPSSPDATHAGGPRIAKFACEHHPKQKCYHCQRLRPAA